jgi:hypothetical protein
MISAEGPVLCTGSWIRNRLPSAVTPNWLLEGLLLLSPYGNNLLGTVASIFGPVRISALIIQQQGSDYSCVLLHLALIGHII